MKKIILGILVGITILSISGIVAGMSASAIQQAYYVESESPALKALFGVNHQFDGVFSTELGSIKLGLLKLMGVKTEPVQIYEIIGKPVCGNGIVEGGEKCGELNLECPEGYICMDCKCKSEEEAIVCHPENQYPWGVIKVNGGSGGEGVTVAVLDTGVDQDHPDLKTNIVGCVTEVTHFKPDTKSCEDEHGHGTHVSGTVLANNGSGSGIYGVAPEAKLITVKVCDKRGWCYGDDMAAGIRYAADNGANIISMSIGGDLPDQQVLEAIDYAVDKEVLVVAAAGNDGPAQGSIDYPGAYVKVIAVGAIDYTEAVPSWSSRGVNDGDNIIEEREVEFGVPGVSIESTYNDGCYAYMSGTSMATPHVSGLAAKLWQDNAENTRNYLQSIANDIWPMGDDTATGFGLPISP